MNYQPRSTNPYIMEKKLNECVGGGGLDPSVLEEMQAEISILGSQNKTQAQDITDIKGSLNSINDNLDKLKIKKLSVPIANIQISNYYATVNTGLDITKYTAIGCYETVTWVEKCNYTLSDAGSLIHIRCVEKTYTIPSNAAPLVLMYIEN